MDELDVKILKSMLREGALCDVLGNFRKSFDQVAREAGVDEGTVRNRLERLESGGFVERSVAIVNPTAMGCTDVHLRIEVSPPSQKEDVIREGAPD